MRGAARLEDGADSPPSSSSSERGRDRRLEEEERGGGGGGNRDRVVSPPLRNHTGRSPPPRSVSGWNPTTNDPLKDTQEPFASFFRILTPPQSQGGGETSKLPIGGAWRFKFEREKDTFNSRWGGGKDQTFVGEGNCLVLAQDLIVSAFVRQCRPHPPGIKSREEDFVPHVSLDSKIEPVDISSTPLRA